jgi:hypothetical protein
MCGIETWETRIASPSVRVGKLSEKGVDRCSINCEAFEDGGLVLRFIGKVALDLRKKVVLWCRTRERYKCLIPSDESVIIIIIIIIGISFMQGIYTYIPETNHVPREHRVATILM